jgi:hypothetical protein
MLHSFAGGTVADRRMMTDTVKVSYVKFSILCINFRPNVHRCWLLSSRSFLFTERGADRAGLSKAASRTAGLDVTSHRDIDHKNGGRRDARITDEWGRRRPASQSDRRWLP